MKSIAVKIILGLCLAGSIISFCIAVYNYQL